MGERSGVKRMYVIRNGEGLFSSGGIVPRFGKQGKGWDTAGKVRSHLAQFKMSPNAQNRPRSARKARTGVEAGGAAEGAPAAKRCGLGLSALELLGLLDLVMAVDVERQCV